MRTTIKAQLLTSLVVAGLLTAWRVAAPPLDEKATITGEGKCARCTLKETDVCQTAVSVEEGGKKVVYYLAHNDVSKEFLTKSMVCRKPAKLKATGTVKDVAGKMELTATKIELVKE